MRSSRGFLLGDERVILRKLGPKGTWRRGDSECFCATGNNTIIHYSMNIPCEDLSGNYVPNDFHTRTLANLYLGHYSKKGSLL